MNDDNDAAVVVDLRGTMQCKVVMHDIIASIGSTVYIRDGVVVYVKPPSEALEPIEAPRLIAAETPTKLPRKREKDKDNLTHNQRAVLILLEAYQEPRPVSWFATELPDIQIGTIRSALIKLTSRGMAVMKRLDGFYCYQIADNVNGNSVKAGPLPEERKALARNAARARWNKAEEQVGLGDVN